MDIYGKREINTNIGQKCDVCGITNLQPGNFIPIKIEFSYGSQLDGATYDFCSLEHTIEFLTNELKKEKENG
jgi:YHS domain-containing protein